jgi:hypothetical protein
MKKILSLIGSLMLLAGGFASAEPKVLDNGKVKADMKIKADIKNIKDVKGSAARNCGIKDCSMVRTDMNK